MELKIITYEEQQGKVKKYPVVMYYEEYYLDGDLWVCHHIICLN